MLSKALGYIPSLTLFRKFFILTRKGDWFIFTFRDNDHKFIGNPLKPSLWRCDYFFVDDTFVPDELKNMFRLGRKVDDRLMNKSVNEKVADVLINRAHYKALRVRSIPYKSYPEGMLAMVGLSPDWDWAEIPILRRRSTRELITLMEGLNLSLSDLEVDAASEDKGMRLRGQVGEVISFKPDGLGNRSLFEMLDDTSLSTLDSLEISDVSRFIIEDPSPSIPFPDPEGTTWEIGVNSSILVKKQTNKHQKTVSDQ
uniref:uncharacterized protein LOC122582644 n=1 Tax=Erigeron canadensis TaxID=72917 RepID=UPI001CB9C408|nr:uncharacterized protein LOC122582644 [Erigeron canadensis]XP_043611001.1 uncharacterized protein LOC122582644 [Erigeron canadensis]XP_043611002.1 uncharacterized protein LOC122582644 [Erigeron canadensis]